MIFIYVFGLLSFHFSKYIMVMIEMRNLHQYKMKKKNERKTSPNRACFTENDRYFYQTYLQQHIRKRPVLIFACTPNFPFSFLPFLFVFVFFYFSVYSLQWQPICVDQISSICSRNNIGQTQHDGDTFDSFGWHVPCRGRDSNDFDNG